MKNLKTFDRFNETMGVDQFDDMEDEIDDANKRAAEMVAFLKGKGYDRAELKNWVDFNQDAEIRINDFIDVVVTVNSTYYVSAKKGKDGVQMSPEMRVQDQLLKTLKEYEKEFTDTFELPK